MAARCPVCEHALDSRSIWRSWREITGDRTLDCPHCGQVLKLTSRSGILIAVADTVISLALLPLLPIFMERDISIVWAVLLYCVAIYLLLGFLYLILGKYEKSTTLSIRR